jgi:hypothetical protein
LCAVALDGASVIAACSARAASSRSALARAGARSAASRAATAKSCSTIGSRRPAARGRAVDGERAIELSRLLQRARIGRLKQLRVGSRLASASSAGSARRGSVSAPTAHPRSIPSAISPPDSAPSSSTRRRRRSHVAERPQALLGLGESGVNLSTASRANGAIRVDMAVTTLGCDEARSCASCGSLCRSYTSLAAPARMVFQRPSVSACSGAHPARADIRFRCTVGSRASASGGPSEQIRRSCRPAASARRAKHRRRDVGKAHRLVAARPCARRATINGTRSVESYSSMPCVRSP